MPYKVNVNDPARPDGDVIEVPGLGVFKNREDAEVSDEQAEFFRAYHARMVDVPTDDRPAHSGAADVELRQGPTVLEAFKDHPTVSVSKVGETKPTATTASKEK